MEFIPVAREGEAPGRGRLWAEKEIGNFLPELWLVLIETPC